MDKDTFAPPEKRASLIPSFSVSKRIALARELHLLEVPSKSWLLVEIKHIA